MLRLEICTPTLVMVALVVALAPAASTVAQTEEPATPSDPAAAPAETEAPTGADLTAINELVLEGSYKEAEAALVGLAEEYPEDPAVFLLHGEVLLAMRHAEQAQAPLMKSLELDPEQPRAQFQLATALNAVGNRADALTHFGTAAAADDPQIALMARLNRSTLFAQERKWDEAAAELEQVLAMQPDNVQVYGDLASMYLRADKTEAATEALQRGRAAGFQSAQHYYSLGARHYRADEHEQAVVALKAALEIDPGMAKAERSLAASLEKIGKRDEALQHFRRYLELAPDAADAEQISAKIKRSESR